LCAALLPIFLFSFSISFAVSFRFVLPGLLLVFFFNYIYARTLRIRNVGNGGTFNPFWGMTTFAVFCALQLAKRVSSWPKSRSEPWQLQLQLRPTGCLDDDVCTATDESQSGMPHAASEKLSLVQCITPHRSRRGQSRAIGEWSVKSGVKYYENVSYSIHGRSQNDLVLFGYKLNNNYF